MEHRLLYPEFSLRVPDEWKDATVHRFSLPRDDGASDDIIVTVDHQPTPPGLKEYAQTAMRAMERTLKGYKLLKRGEMVLDARLPGYEVVYRWQPTDGVKQYRQMVFVFANQAAFSICVTFTKKAWKVRGAEIGKLIKTFSVPETVPDD